MKNPIRILALSLWITALLAVPFLMFAQVDTNAVPPVPDVTNAPLPASTFEFWTYGIAVIVPLIVGGIKKIVPSIPTWLLPVSTPFVGLALGAFLNWVGASNLSWVDMGQAGALAVFIREAWNQAVTTPIKGAALAKTKGPEVGS